MAYPISEIKAFVHFGLRNQPFPAIFTGDSFQNIRFRKHLFLTSSIGNPLQTVADTISDSPSAGLQPEQRFDWEKQWYPLAVVDFTDKNKSHKLHLLGNEVVLWYDGTTWRVFEDSCPHRGVPLSKLFYFFIAYGINIVVVTPIVYVNP